MCTSFLVQVHPHSKRALPFERSLAFWDPYGIAWFLSHHDKIYVLRIQSNEKNRFGTKKYNTISSVLTVSLAFILDSLRI